MLKLATKFAPAVPAFETAYRAGFRHAEFWLSRDILAGWRDISRAARHYPMTYALHFPNRLDLPAETLEQLVSLYHHVNARCLIIHQGMHDKFREPLLRLHPSLQLAVENGGLSAERFALWAEQNDGLTLDVEHFWKYSQRNAPLGQVLAQLRDFLGHYSTKLRHVHLPGYSPGSEEHRPMYSSRAMIFPVLSALQDFDFEGLVVSEVSPEYQNLNDLRMDMLLFDTWREQHDPVVAPFFPTTPAMNMESAEDA